MLTLTDDAVQAIRDLMVGEDLPQNAGMRISAVESDPGSLELSLTSGPQAGDPWTHAGRRCIVRHTERSRTS